MAYLIPWLWAVEMRRFRTYKHFTSPRLTRNVENAWSGYPIFLVTIVALRWDYVRFKVFRAAGMKVAFWYIALCSLFEVDRRFRWTYCLHHRGYSDCAAMRSVVDSFFTLCTQRLSLSSWWWRQFVRLKRRSTSTRLHGAISQKTGSDCFYGNATGPLYITHLIHEWIWRNGGIMLTEENT
jgi:hypothetical protein